MRGVAGCAIGSMALLARLNSRKSRKYWTFGNMAGVCGVLFPKVTKILDFWE